MDSKTPIIPADADGIARAAEVLAGGGLVAVPTETVYGLAARADDDAAVARIYEAKGRPGFNPLIVHVTGWAKAKHLAEIPGVARAMMIRFWPGPLTLVLERKPDARLAAAVTAGLPTVAVRAPAHPAMRALLEACDFPLAAPSANRSGFISPTTAEHVAASLDGRIDLILDGGPCFAGLESTILAVRADGTREVLRPGPLDLGETAPAGGIIEAPGQLSRHYAPGKPVRLEAAGPEADEFMIGFGAVAGDCSLSDTGSLDEAATRLYACLYEAAQSDKLRIAVARVPEEGIGIAINDRLRRAAS